MDGHAQKRVIRKLDLELFLGSLATQPSPQWQLEQYTTPEGVAANMLYLAAYGNGDVVGKRVLDLGCGTARLGLGAAFLDASEVVGVDIDGSAIKTACKNAGKADLGIQLIHGDIAAISGRFDTVVMNPPFGVQHREADRAFLIKALEVANSVYSLHNHPAVDERLIRMLKSVGGMVHVKPNPFLERFIGKNGGFVVAVYSMLMTIPKMFDFHKKLKHDFVIDLYVIRKK